VRQNCPVIAKADCPVAATIPAAILSGSINKIHLCQAYSIDSHDPTTKIITNEHRNGRRLLSRLLIVTPCSVHWLQTAKSAQLQRSNSNKTFTAPPQTAQINDCGEWCSTI
jgi:hypothetical protein